MDPMKIALTICWSIRPSNQSGMGSSLRPLPSFLLARLDLVDEREAALAVHRNDPHRLLDVVCARELERPERRLNVDRLHRRAQLVAVAGEVAARKVGSLRRVGDDLDSRVALSRELVRIRA